MATDNQTKNSKPWLWQKGQSGNRKGRPKGRSLKEWTRERIAKMTDEERMNFLNSIDTALQWKMAEGNPTSELTGKDGNDLIPALSPAMKKYADQLLDAQRNTNA